MNFHPLVNVPFFLSSFIMAGCSTFSSSDDVRISSLKAPSLPDFEKQHSVDHRAEAMKNYQQFLTANRDNKYAPEALRRLADLNMEDEQTRQIEGGPVQEESIATELYKNLLTQHPQHENNDSATYQLARAYELQGDNASTFQALTEYTKNYPDADNIGEVYFRRGEYLFSLGEFEEANLAYSQVTAHHQESDFFQPALYKGGWSQFKLNDIDSALDTFILLLDKKLPDHHSSSLPDTMGRSQQERLQDTLRVIGLSFAYLGNADIVEKYFSRNGRKNYEPLVYASVAALHLSKQRYTDAADTYQRFAKTNPGHREAPLFQSYVIRVYQDAGFDERVLEEKESFAKNYVPGSAYWQQHDMKDSPDIIALVKTYLDDITNHYHALAQEEKIPAAYQIAISWYERYFQGFSSRSEFATTNFLFAELLLESGRIQQAITEYNRTAYDYGQHEKSAEAGYAALLAHTKHEPSLELPKEKASWHRDGITMALRFSNTFPTHTNAITVKTRAAEQLYALQEYPLTIETSESIVSIDNLPAELLISNWKLIAHSYFETSNYASAEAGYQQLLLLIQNDHEQINSVTNRLAASIYKQGEIARDKNALSIAIKHFNRVAIVAPATQIAATAGYDAATAYITLNMLTEAITSLENWRISYPSNKLKEDATNKLAYLYSETQQPLKAAAEYENISVSNPDPSQQRAALWSAASLYLDASDVQKAIDTYERYVNRYPVPENQALEARATLVKLYNETNNAHKAHYWNQQIIAAYTASPLLKNKRGRFLAANSQLALARPYKRQYLSISLAEPLQENLALKKKYLESAVNAFSLAAKYNIVEITTQATFETGNIYSDFSKAVLNSERPTGLNTEELEQYTILLEDEAFPIEEQAIEIHEANIQYIADGHYNEWTKNSLKQLSELLPGRYNKTERIENYVSQ